MDESTIESIKEKNPGAELHQLSAAGFQVIARSPRKADMDMFRDLIFNEKLRSRAMEKLVRCCVLHPSREELSAIFESKPALIERFSEQLLALGGGEEEVEVKKL